LLGKNNYLLGSENEVKVPSFGPIKIKSAKLKATKSYISFSNEFEAKILVFRSNAIRDFLSKKFNFPNKYFFGLAKVGSQNQTAYTIFALYVMDIDFGYIWVNWI
jgi:hypothetical protein